MHPTRTFGVRLGRMAEQAFFPARMVNMLLLLGSIGAPEMIFIIGLALLIFGPKKIPEIARSLGKGVREFKQGTSGLMTSLNEEMNKTPEPKQPAATTEEAAPPALAQSTVQPTVQAPPKDVEAVVINMEEGKKD